MFEITRIIAIYKASLETAQLESRSSPHSLPVRRVKLEGGHRLLIGGCRKVVQSRATLHGRLRFWQHAVEVEQNGIVIARRERDNRSNTGHDLFLSGNALVSCSMESACRCDIRKAYSLSRAVSPWLQRPQSLAPRAASIVQIPEPSLAINKKMKQNSTAGSPPFSSGQKLFGKWPMK